MVPLWVARPTIVEYGTLGIKKRQTTASAESSKQI